MITSGAVHELKISADGLTAALLSLSATEHVSILDSCGVRHLGSHLLIAGIEPVAVLEHKSNDSRESLSILQTALDGPHACFFTLSYELGRKLQGIESKKRSAEPDVFISTFEALIIHDYETGSTCLTGNAERFGAIEQRIMSARLDDRIQPQVKVRAMADLSRPEYLNRIDQIQELIRAGETYQTNLTQQLRCPAASAAATFKRLRMKHPAPFAAFITRPTSIVVSASPERFFKVEARKITTSPIKGTRPRGATTEEDDRLRRELLISEKDRAENTMIVDLLRNDLGRVCEYGSVQVDDLCELEVHPTLFHLVSTVSGTLRPEVRTGDILRALFPCGSITGAPKINTMKIIERLEPTARGLSMGAIGYHVPPEIFGIGETLDLSVAIRTAVFRDGTATFNVGGGITIESVPEEEYEESLLKARALLLALEGEIDGSLEPGVAAGV